jgi:hypothetical protein
MKINSDPVLDYLNELITFINKHRWHLQFDLPPNFASYPDADQRVWIKNLEILARAPLAPANTMQLYVLKRPKDTPKDVESFVYNDGPRPAITG